MSAIVQGGEASGLEAGYPAMPPGAHPIALATWARWLTTNADAVNVKSVILGPEAPAAENPDVDEATLVSTLAELANIGKKKSSGPRTRGGPGPGQMTLPDATSNPAPPSPSPSPASAAPSPRSRRLQLVPSLGQDPAVKDSTPSGVGDPPPPARNPVRRRTPCMSCGVILRVGEGDTRVDPDSGADISVCWPACHSPSRAPDDVSDPTS